jgi:single-strand DNA-binding protein
MAQGNNVTLVGNLTRDPELRYTASGLGVASLGIAVNHRRQVNGEWQEEVSFFNITAFGDLGENVAASLNKGNRILVTGRLRQNNYETREGEKRSTVEVVADEIGPSLRWAQAQVERISRDSADGGSNRGGGGGGGGGDGGAAASRAPEPSYGDEEPF